ncbi:MAG: hypothetical protein HYX92_10190 [Chloroflexi bacterium]|nr:hypothetical protein [Chloroflexota bacterium]
MRPKLTGSALLLWLAGSALIIAATACASTPDDFAAQAASSQSSAAMPQGNAAVSSRPIEIVVAGYVTHGPLKPTVDAVKEVAAKYGDSIHISSVDMSSKEGKTYFKDHKLTAHMNIIINGKYEYTVNGKKVVFQWFEGQQWTKQDLDAVLASLVGA